MSERSEKLFAAAVAEHLAGRPASALPLYVRMLAAAPDDFRALHLGAAAAYQCERLEQAVAWFGRALVMRPQSGVTRIGLGLALAAAGRNVEAESQLRVGIGLEKGNPEAWLNFGSFLLTTGRLPEALRSFRRAVELRPDYAAAWTGIGTVAQASGQAADALASFRTGLRFDPASETAALGLVQALQSLHRVPEALAECDRLLAARPLGRQAASHRLFLLNYLDDIDPAAHFAEHTAFGARWPVPPAPQFAQSREPDRPIRLAFLSPDLRTHSVACFLEPLLAALDRREFEVLLYHDHSSVDAVSARLRRSAQLWRNYCGQPDSVVEARIRADAPDVLIDLAGHSGHNRLPLFARRLAPVQITYLGYPNTTGLTAMDYRFTDARADPVGAADRQYTERLVRFADCAWSYAPPAVADPIIPVAGGRDRIAFGSFNSLSKVNATTLRLWGAVLAQVPGSRLVLKSFGLEPEPLTARLREAGIDPGRVELLLPEREVSAHLARYREIDIALDPFPYGGTTTTCEALWMGRPVVTLRGDRPASRVGASLLAAIGKPEWVASTPEEFQQIAVGLANDRSRLRTESAGLRSALQASPLLDHAGQGRRFGAAVRACWREWCVGPTASAFAGGEGPARPLEPALV
jgi:predicted O-linked N-acetylglucosamine transferase (SPINDLY family)